MDRTYRRQRMLHALRAVNWARRVGANQYLQTALERIVDDEDAARGYQRTIQPTDDAVQPRPKGKR